jgi:hypothetical protein
VTLTREALLAPVTTEVHLPEFGGPVRIRALRAADLFRWQDVAKDKERAPEAMAILVQAAVMNEDGSPMFEPKDVPALMEVSFMALETIAAAVLKLSRLDTASRDAAQGN